MTVCIARPWHYRDFAKILRSNISALTRPAHKPPSKMMIEAVTLGTTFVIPKKRASVVGITTAPDISWTFTTRE